MTKPVQTRTSGLSGVAACAASFMFMFGQGAARAQDAPDAAASTSSDAIVASLNPVADGLACSDAASQAQVSFDFQKPDFEIKQISLYVDGHGVAPESVNQQWPRVTLSSGLHPGRNTVEIVATGDNDHSLARQLTVLIGVPPQAGDDNAAIVQCDNSRTQVAATPPPAAQPQQQVVEAPPPTVITQTVYVEEPVYVYHPVPAYPVWPVFVPIIPIVIGYPPFPAWYPPHRYCPPPQVTYYPYPPPRMPPPVAYRPPAYQAPAGGNAWRTPTPITGTPVPINGVPAPYQQPGGANRGPRGGGVVYSTQSSSDPRWGVVNDMNQGGNGTRYRTPPAPPPQAPPRTQPYGGGVVIAPGNPHGQQSYGAPAQPQYGYQGGNHGAPPHQSFVHEPPVQHYEAPRPMSPPRMSSSPQNHPPMQGGAH